MLFQVPTRTTMAESGGTPSAWVTLEQLTAMLKAESSYMVAVFHRQHQENGNCINFPVLCRSNNPYAPR